MFVINVIIGRSVDVLAFKSHLYLILKYNFFFLFTLLLFLNYFLLINFTFDGTEIDLIVS